MLQRLTNAEPAAKLPDDVAGLQIALKLTGGIGDVLIALGGAANHLASRGAYVTLGVRDFQIELLSKLEGVAKAVPITRFNDPVFRRQFAAVVDLSGVFASQRQIRDAEYYGLAAEKLGVPTQPPHINVPTLLPYPNSVFIHASASNPNRCWPTERWAEVAYHCAGCGFDVRFLGTRADFGFTDTGIQSLSCISENLFWQTCELSRATLFVGNDSGFAHIAGCLGVPGVVLFGNTHPRNVIARYPTMTGISACDRLGVAPSRSLRVDDESSIRCMAAVEVAEVITALATKNRRLSSAIACIHRQPQEKTRTRVVVVGADTITLSELFAWFDVEVGEGCHDEPLVRFDGITRYGDLTLDARLTATDKRNLIQSWLAHQHGE